MERVLMSRVDELVVAWVATLHVGDVIHGVVCAHIRKRGAVVGGFEAEFGVGLVFAGVEGTEFAETNGVGH